MFYLIIRLLGIILFKALFRLEVYGQKNIPLQGGFILASNHISYLDPPALAVACPRALSFLAKEELFKNILFARLITGLNTFPICSRSGDVEVLRNAVQKLKKGRALTIFPEGARIADGRISEPRRGIGLLAAKAKVSIVPAFIKGSNKALPINGKFIRPKKIRVYFGQAIWPEEIKVQSKGKDFYQAIAKRTMEEIRRLQGTAV